MVRRRLWETRWLRYSHWHLSQTIHSRWGRLIRSSINLPDYKQTIFDQMLLMCGIYTSNCPPPLKKKPDGVHSICEIPCMYFFDLCVNTDKSFFLFFPVASILHWPPPVCSVRGQVECWPLSPYPYGDRQWGRRQTDHSLSRGTCKCTYVCWSPASEFCFASTVIYGWVHTI